MAKAKRQRTPKTLETANYELQLTRAQLKRAQKSTLQLQALADELVEAAGILEPLPTLKLPSKKSGQKSAVAVLCLSDWHIGLRVEPTQTQESGEYDLLTANLRLTRLIQRFQEWIETSRRGQSIEHLEIFSLGDMINGLIHLENLIEDELDVADQVVQASYLLAWVVQQLVPSFKSAKLTILCTDNHSRLTKKVHASGRAGLSLGTVIAKMTEGLLREHKTLTVNCSTSIKTDVQILGWTFCLEHGNDVRSWMGLPFYGIQRMSGRDAKRRAAFRQPGVDYHVLGHFHTSAILDDVIVCPSLVGSTVYDHASGRYGWPAQTAFLVSEDLGVCNYMPINLWR